LLFHLAQVVVINKVDLLPYVDFSVEKAESDIRKENPRALIYGVSAKTGEGFEELSAYIEKLFKSK
jgi:hydrogenase nickel incorporation protein HypB